MRRDTALRALRADALGLFDAAVSAADARQAVGRYFAFHGDAVEVDGEMIPVSSDGKVFLLGIGKASHAMGLAVEEALEERIDDGVLVVPDPVLPGRVTRLAGAHPLPEERSLEAGQSLLRIAVEAQSSDLAIVVLSGGGSSMAVVPAPGLSLESVRETHRVLLGCGADIHAMNVVRKHLSALKGGRLAEAVAPARMVCLWLSDVIGDDLQTIASGPCAPDPSSFGDALEVLGDHGLNDRIPVEVLRHLERGSHGDVRETPEENAPCFGGIKHRVVANNTVAVEAAAAAARIRGYEVVCDTNPVFGEAREVGERYSAEIIALQESGKRMAVIRGGEPTVTLGEDVGQGGRSQELAVSAAMGLAGRTGVVLLAAGTDGVDGETDAAGGLVDGATIPRAAMQGLSPVEALAGHNVYPLLDATNDLLRMGPTGTNVMDLHVLLCSPDVGE